MPTSVRASHNYDSQLCTLCIFYNQKEAACKVKVVSGASVSVLYLEPRGSWFDSISRRYFCPYFRLSYSPRHWIFVWDEKLRLWVRTQQPTASEDKFQKKPEKSCCTVMCSYSGTQGKRRNNWKEARKILLCSKLRGVLVVAAVTWKVQSRAVVSSSSSFVSLRRPIQCLWCWLLSPSGPPGCRRAWSPTWSALSKLWPGPQHALGRPVVWELDLSPAMLGQRGFYPAGQCHS